MSDLTSDHEPLQPNNHRNDKEKPQKKKKRRRSPVEEEAAGMYSSVNLDPNYKLPDEETGECQYHVVSTRRYIIRA
jgi:hypothetical protein